METCKCSKEKEIATLISENKSMFKQFDAMQSDLKEMNKIYDTIYEMVRSVSVLTSQMMEVKSDLGTVKSDMKDIKKISHNVETINDIKKEVAKLKEQPLGEYAHYKKLIVGGIITTALGGILGAILTMILR